MRLTCIFLLIYFNCINSVTGQNETSKWYFGAYCAVDFMTNPPSMLAPGSMSTQEGSASIADAAGNLLFYTDGVTVWDKFGGVMGNGTGLLGNNSTTQSSLIVKQPGAAATYFVFTLDDYGGPNGLCYSMVDMSLAAGMGSVTIKNIMLYTPSSEKMTAVKHCNGTDVWLISHELNSNTFRTFLVTSAGVNTMAVVSTFTNTEIYKAGCMKASPNGKKMALAESLATPAFFELYDFDNVSGAVSNRIRLYEAPVPAEPYGCEFSPDGSKVYASNSGDILQWDLCSRTEQELINSQYYITTSSVYEISLQLAPDGKIYAAEPTYSPGLGIIQNPNNVGAACNYVNQGLAVTSGTVLWGLPNFVSSYFFTKSPLPFYTLVGCLTATFEPQLCAFSSPSVNSVSWDFGDPGSGSANTSTLLIATHDFSVGGTYTVRAIRQYNCYVDTISQSIEIPDYPAITISGKSNICSGETTTLTVSGTDSYSWAAGSFTTSQIAVSPTVTTTYSVTGTNTLTGCSVTKMVHVAVSGCSGLAEEHPLEFLKIFPNPSQGIVQLEASDGLELELYDQQGILMLEHKSASGQQSLDLRTFPKGIYFLIVKAKNGTRKCLKLVLI